MHHHGSGQFDVDALDERTRRVCHVIPEVRRERAVGEEHHLARDGVDLRMRRHRSGQRSPEVVFADGGERCVELDRAGGLHHRERPAGVDDDVRVRGVLHHPSGLHHLRRRKAELGQPAEQGVAGSPLGIEAGGAHPTISIGRTTVAESDGVDHAVTVEHVVAGDRRERRVGPVAQVGADQRPGQLPDDLEVDVVPLVGHRFVVADQVRTGRRGRNDVARHARTVPVRRSLVNTVHQGAVDLASRHAGLSFARWDRSVRDQASKRRFDD